MKMIGNTIESNFITWKHFIPFPRGYVFWDTGNNKSIFLQFKKIETNAIENTGNVLCDCGNFFSETEYTPKLLAGFQKSNKGPAIELRMREASILSRESLTCLFQRHNGFVHEFSEDVMTEAVLFLSCCYAWNKNAKLPKQLENFQKNGFLSHDEVLFFVEKEVFMVNQSFELDFGIRWIQNQLGPFVVFEHDNHWHVGHKKLKKTIMKNFLYRMDAQIHAESLFCYLKNHPNEKMLDTILSVLDLVIMDSFPLSKPAVYSYDD